MASPLHRQALRIFHAAVKAAAPAEAVLRHLKLRGDNLFAGRQRYRLNAFQNIYVIGAGKAGAQMARAVERLLGPRITAGLVNVKAGESARLRRVELNESGHPIPDPNGARGAARIAQIAQQAGPGDLVIVSHLRRRVGSTAAARASVRSPRNSKRRGYCSIAARTIHEINCIRKHISLVKGGGLARLAYPATVVTLILSDVIGDDLDVIGIGPYRFADRTTFADAKAVFEKYAVWNKVPPAVRDRLSGSAPETPKPGDPVFAKVQNLIVGSNRLAVDAAARQARALGLRTLVLSSVIQGEAREVGRVFAAVAQEMCASGRPVKPPACVIAGGETTVTIHGTGLGGRNQEFALAAAIDIAGLKNIVVLSAGTDGADGPTDAAGAIADGTSIGRAQHKGLDAVRLLANNDSYHFFEGLGDLIKTGPTGTNVADIQIILVS